MPHFSLIFILFLRPTFFRKCLYIDSKLTTNSMLNFHHINFADVNIQFQVCIQLLYKCFAEATFAARHAINLLLLLLLPISYTGLLPLLLLLLLLFLPLQLMHDTTSY
jgi:hypothetical protein